MLGLDHSKLVILFGCLIPQLASWIHDGKGDGSYVQSKGQQHTLSLMARGEKLLMWIDYNIAFKQNQRRSTIPHSYKKTTWPAPAITRDELVLGGASVTDVHVLQNPKLVMIGSMTEGDLHVVLELFLPEPI